MPASRTSNESENLNLTTENSPSRQQPLNNPPKSPKMDSAETTRPSSPSNKPVKPRKFRSSCDSCSASKVKCDQGKPQCLRCGNLGLKCSYSPSRRMGKPPASARQLSKSSNASSSDSEKHTVPNPAKRRQLSPPSEINVPIPSIENQCTYFSPPLMDAEDFMSMNWQEDIFSSSTFSAPSADTQLTSGNLFDFNFDFTPDLTQINNQLVFGDDGSLDFSRTSSRDPLFDPLQLFPSETSQSTAKISPRSSLTPPNICAHQADLGRTRSPTPFLDTNSSIDQVLITNKAEIENAYKLLACDCSHNPHFALTLALICNKILAMYEAVIKPSPPSSNSSSSGSIGITFGAYKMDAEDEERVRIQIVVNELRKVKGLVDEYANKYGMGDCTAADEEGAVYSALVSFLRTKFATTLQDLLTRLE